MSLFHTWQHETCQACHVSRNARHLTQFWVGTLPAGQSAVQLALDLCAAKTTGWLCSLCRCWRGLKEGDMCIQAKCCRCPKVFLLESRNVTFLYSFNIGDSKRHHGSWVLSKVYLKSWQSSKHRIPVLEHNPQSPPHKDKDQISSVRSRSLASAKPLFADGCTRNGGSITRSGRSWIEFPSFWGPTPRPLTTI